MSTTQERRPELDAQILKALASGPLWGPDLARACNAPERTTRDHCAALCDEGKLRRIRIKHEATYRMIYGLANRVRVRPFPRISAGEYRAYLPSGTRPDQIQGIRE